MSLLFPWALQSLVKFWPSQQFRYIFSYPRNTPITVSLPVLSRCPPMFFYLFLGLPLPLVSADFHSVSFLTSLRPAAIRSVYLSNSWAFIKLRCKISMFSKRILTYWNPFIDFIISVYIIHYVCAKVFVYLYYSFKRAVISFFLIFLHRLHDYCFCLINLYSIFRTYYH